MKSASKLTSKQVTERATAVPTWERSVINHYEHGRGLKHVSYMLFDELKRFLGEIKSGNFTVSNSEITIFAVCYFHCW